MTGKIYVPKHPGKVIASCWEIKAEENETVLTHFVPPFGAPEFIFFFGERSQILNADVIHGLIKGQYETPQRIHLRPGYHLLGFRLRPFGLRQLFHIDARVLTNAFLDVQHYELTRSITESLVNAGARDMELVRYISGIIESWPRETISNETIAFLREVEQSDETHVTAIARNAGLSIRSLQRKFSVETGLSPKKYLRIVRMGKIESRLPKSKNWIEIVADFDFADQSHLIKEFKILRHHTPEALLEHKLLLTDQFPSPERVEY